MSTKQANKTTKVTAQKADSNKIETQLEEKGGTPEQQLAAPESESPIVEEPELSEHEQELNRRIDPSQPMIDPGAEEAPRYSAESVIVTAAPSEKSPELEDHVSDEALEMFSAFAKLYPGNRVFHFTSDGQMFLDANKRDAETHEKNIAGAGVQSFEVQ